MINAAHIPGNLPAPLACPGEARCAAPFAPHHRLLLKVLLIAVCSLTSGLASSVCAGQIDTGWIEAPWPKERHQELEVGSDTVIWRWSRSKTEVYAGADFTVPIDRGLMWQQTTNFDELKQIAPGVQSIKVLKEEPDYQVVELVMKVLWYTVTMRFELEREAPELTRFRLMSQELGEYVGYMRLTPTTVETKEGPVVGTAVKMGTWLKPAMPVSTRLILMAERMVLLSSIREFIQDCREAAAAAAARGRAS